MQNLLFPSFGVVPRLNVGFGKEHVEHADDGVDAGGRQEHDAPGCYGLL
jgi:hypothetical protein